MYQKEKTGIQSFADMITQCIDELLEQNREVMWWLRSEKEIKITITKSDILITDKKGNPL